MTYGEVMAELGARRNEQVYKQNVKRGVGENQFGVTSSDLRTLAKQIKTNPELAEELWTSGNVDAMMLATLLMKPKQMSVDDLNRLLQGVKYDHVADWLATNVVKPHPLKETQRDTWMNSDHQWSARMGWSLTTERVIKSPEGLDLPALLDRIEAEMGLAPAAKQWTMNYCLAEIGIRFPELRARAIAIGEHLGVFRDFPCSKGCVSPFAPVWITEMVHRGSKN